LNKIGLGALQVLQAVNKRILRGFLITSSDLIISQIILLFPVCNYNYLAFDILTDLGKGVLKPEKKNIKGIPYHIVSTLFQTILNLS
jgi:hypothetical protein